LYDDVRIRERQMLSKLVYSSGAVQRQGRHAFLKSLLHDSFRR